MVLFSLTSLYGQELGTFFSVDYANSVNNLKVYKSMEIVKDTKREIAGLIQLSRNMKKYTVSAMFFFLSRNSIDHLLLKPTNQGPSAKSRSRGP